MDTRIYTNKVKTLQTTWLHIHQQFLEGQSGRHPVCMSKHTCTSLVTVQNTATTSIFIHKPSKRGVYLPSYILGDIDSGL